MLARSAFCIAAAFLLAACSEAGSATVETAKTAPAPAAPAAAPTPGLELPLITVADPPPASSSPLAQAIDAAAFTAKAGDAAAAKTLLVRVQVMLDRAHFSPGVIDGRNGENLRQALAAFEAARGLPADGVLDEASFAALSAQSPGPAMTDYVITAKDVAGPFVEKIPVAEKDMAALDKLSFTGPLELLAETFHMDEALLKALNPGVDFKTAGQTIVVAQVARPPLTAPAARVEVDKTEREVRVYADDGTVLAVYPATVGSADRPTPAGEWAVRAVAKNPTWNYDPKRLTFGDGKETLSIAAGPNNPVGTIWIALTKDTYGIHGSADPKAVGKASSHGCVRLTNWDAEALGAAVKAGTVVTFVGEEAKAAGTKA